MTGLAVALLVVAAFDPPGVSLRLAAARTDRRRIGVVAAAAVAVALIWVTEPLLDGLGVEPESFWIAAGLVLAAAGLVRVATPRGARPVPGGHDAHWAVPIAYPGVLGPELVLAAMAAGSHGDSVAGTLAVAAGAAVVVVVPASGPFLVAATTRLVAAAQVVLAVALIVDGIRSV